MIIPCFNEEKVLGETHRRLAEVAGRHPDLPFEFVYIDDGSSDGSVEILRQLQREDPRVRVVFFSRNFGHQVAITAGVDHAAGAAVIVIDADLQDPPEVISEMIARWQQGFHVVYGRRLDRSGESYSKLWTARAFYRLMNRLSDTEIPMDTGDFRLMDRAVVHALQSMPERDRFIRGMVSWVGFRQTAVEYHRQPRYAGRSNYPFMKMLRFAFDGITSFSRAPLKFATLLGFTASVIALMGIVYALVVRLFTDAWVTGWTALFIAVLFIGGVQLISLGIIGEYIGRIYGEVKRRPLYVVQEVLGFEQDG